MASRPHRILLFDSTLRDGLQGHGKHLSVQHRLEVARHLDRAGIDIIEAGYCINDKADLEGLSAVAAAVSGATVCGLAAARDRDIDRVAAALTAGQAESEFPALKPFRINTFLSTRLKKSDDRDRTLELVRQSVRYARQFTDDVQWTAMEATNSQLDMLGAAAAAAIGSGASTICIADTQGQAAPEEFASLLAAICQRVSLQGTVLAVHCHNHSGWAVDNALAALNAGACQLEGTLEGLGPAGGNTDLGKLVMGIHANCHAQAMELGVDLALLDRAAQEVLRYWPKASRVS